MAVFVLVSDLFFKAKISETAKLVGAEIVFAKSPAEVVGAKLVVVDLEKFGADAVLVLKKQNPRAKIVGFLSHVQVDLKKEAQKNGCDLVLAKSEFSKRLAELIRQ